MLEILTPAEMAEADKRTIAHGPMDGYALMLRAGEAVLAEILRRFPHAATFQILCGPGNNGGDGYVVARRLAEQGLAVELYGLGTPPAGGDAERARADCPIEVRPLSAFMPAKDGLVVDALFGAGLARPLEGDAGKAVQACTEGGHDVMAIDLPSGVSGDSGRVETVAFKAALTVTFARMKPGHLLYPGKAHCGRTVVADIGIRDEIVRVVSSSAYVNAPPLWRDMLPSPDCRAHKYRRGHCAVFSGGPSSTGAARLSCMAAARIGAGAVTLLSPANALQVNAAHLTSTMLARIDDEEALRAFIEEKRPAAFVIGPGFGEAGRLRDYVFSMLEYDAPGAGRGLVLDADSFTAFADAPELLFGAIGDAGDAVAVMTPHEGEFARVFPDLADDPVLSKLERARQAAVRAGGIVVYKGADTVIAAPDGRAAINDNGTPWLATAGSGDVLAGMIAGLMAQGMPAFEAACASVWTHASAGAQVGRGLIADDLPALLPGILDAVITHEGDPDKGRGLRNIFT